MNARDERLTPRLVLSACWMAARYYIGEAVAWVDRAWPAILLGLILGILAGIGGTRDQARQCLASPDTETAQIVCPDWLR